MNNQTNQNYNNGPPWFSTWVIISVVEMLMCNMLTGVITLVFILLSDSDYKQGKIEDAEKKKKAAMITTIVGLVLGILTLILTLVLIFGGMLAFIDFVPTIT